ELARAIIVEERERERERRTYLRRGDDGVDDGVNDGGARRRKSPGEISIKARLFPFILRNYFLAFKHERIMI
ncbi:hypothetical protein, partial [Paraclostridium benzoelyticum]|uniref:hypothetical protein n=1 Tax=Paraclostridium benzoelyticum TaxID=1629550 RepID=UPI001A9A4335